MSKPFLTYCIPSIRTNLLEELYNKLDSYTDIPWELSLVSPYDLPEGLKKKSNIVYSQSWRCPSACQQMAVEQSNGIYQLWLADDARPLPFLREYTNLPSLSDSWDTCYLAKYGESNNFFNDDYFRLNNALPRSPHIPDSFWVFNVCIIRTDYLLHLGGFNCEFETTFFAHTDLGCRAQFLGCQTKFFKGNIANNFWEESTSGSHAPIHYAHTQHDEWLYRKKYVDGPCVNPGKIVYWTEVPSVWNRRFS